MGESTGAHGQGATPTPPRLTAGGSVSGGRYELLEPHGGVAGQAFWRARDRRLGRDVALTFVDPLPGEQPPGSAPTVLDRTVALTRVYSDGSARVLDVIRGRAGGIVVTEWVPGRSLAAAATDPRPDSAVAAVRGLADAAARAEELGLVLGLDSPDRIRLTEDGRAVLAFPGVSTTADATADIRGLGAVLYALLTGTWPGPLPEGSTSHDPCDGRPEAAPRNDDDEVLDPTLVHDGVAPDAAVLAMRSLDGSSVSSAATVRAMLGDRVGGPAGRHGSASPGWAAAGTATSSAATSSAATHAVLSPGAATPSAPAADADDPASDVPTDGPADAPGTSWPDDEGMPRGPYAAAGADPADAPDPETLKRRWQIMAGAGAAAVVVIALLGAWMLGGLAGDQNDTPLSQQLDAIERAAQASRSSQAAEPAAQEPADDPTPTTSAAPSTPVRVSTVTAWQPASSAGTAENSASAPAVADGDQSTAWSTDTYLNQLGDGASAFKSGVGLMFTLDGEQETRRVVIRSADEGVQFEVRAADSASPTSLDDTRLLGRGTVRDGSGTLTIDEPEESEYLLVWFTRLGTSGPQSYSATVSEVELTR